MCSDDKTSAQAKVKPANPATFMRTVKNNPEECIKFRQMTDSLFKEHIVGRDGWAYLIVNLPLDLKNENKATLDFIEDRERALILYQEMDRKGIDRAILLMHVSPRLAEILKATDDIQMMSELARDLPREKKVILCNKNFDG